MLTHNCYGKSQVRLTKVVRNGGRHELFEITADIELQGDFAPAYTEGDNTQCIATDSMKNTVYVLAKENNFTSIEQFALLLGKHFVGTYSQVRQATVELRQANWRRIEVGGAGHDHAFTSGGSQQRYAKAVVGGAGAGPVLIGGLRNQTVLKTTASEWRDFVTDRYRTLKDAGDRIFATAIDADWTYNTLSTDFNAAFDAITTAILETFATQHSLGAQHTLLAMGEGALKAAQVIDSISFTLPNLHRIPFNLEPFGLKFENDVFVATDEPYGLIKGTVTR